MSNIEHSEPDETTREWVTGLLGRTPEAESIIRHIEWLDGEAARRTVDIQGAVEATRAETLREVYAALERWDERHGHGRPDPVEFLRRRLGGQ